VEKPSVEEVQAIHWAKRKGTNNVLQNTSSKQKIEQRFHCIFGSYFLYCNVYKMFLHDTTRGFSLCKIESKFEKDF
jgi:hypothetical protein